MREKTFRFKQFAVLNDRAAMKVGTDGVLLGAWAPLPACEAQPARVLDIGTGSGLIALMIAQRCPEAVIDAIDIDADAVAEARHNVAQSPWSERIAVRQADFATAAIETSYDLIVSNPPFFDGTAAPDAHRAAARSTATLSPATLIGKAAALLAPRGILAVVYPHDALQRIIALAVENGLAVAHVTEVATRPGAAPKRVLAAFCRGVVAATLRDSFTLEAPDHSRSPQYAALTADFYL